MKMNKNAFPKITLLKDSEWSTIDGIPCKVIDFSPLLASVQDGKVISHDHTTPYGSVTLEVKGIKGAVTGFITQKSDFGNLWDAFKARTTSNNEEVIIIWTKKRYKNKLFTLYSVIWPKLLVFICHKGAFRLVNNINDLIGETRTKATMPIDWWKPDIME